MSEIIEFYRNESDARGVGWFTDIVNRWSDEHWERSHDFIQWLFPLKTPSNFNPDAPLLTDEDIALLSDPKSKALEANIFHAFQRFLRFLGLRGEFVFDNNNLYEDDQYPSDKWRVWKADNFVERENLWNKSNHNWLRITRVLACLKLLKFDPLSNAFFKCLCELYNKGYGSADSLGYWQKAAEGLIQ